MAGLTAAKIQLNADVNTLIADSTDLSLIIASVRDASGKCVYSSIPVTFAVTGPCTVFDTLTRPAIAGKTAIIIKSTNSTGAITVTASAAGLTHGTVTLQSVAPDNSALPFIWPIVGAENRIQPVLALKQIKIVQDSRYITAQFPSAEAAAASVSLVTIAGKSLRCPTAQKGYVVALDIRGIGRGVYYLTVQAGGAVEHKKVVLSAP